MEALPIIGKCNEIAFSYCRRRSRYEVIVSGYKEAHFNFDQVEKLEVLTYDISVKRIEEEEATGLLTKGSNTT